MGNTESRLRKLEDMMRVLLTKAAAGGTTDHDSLTGVSADDHHTEDHAARHNTGGADAIDAYYALTNPHTHEAIPTAHKTTHSPGGSDTLDGYYATTAQNLTHATRHSPGGADTVDIYYATTAAFLNHKARHAKGGADALDAFYAETIHTASHATDLAIYYAKTNPHVH